MIRLAAILFLLALFPSASSWAEGFVLPVEAKSAVVMDGNTGEFLIEIRADERVYPASTTKILTIHLAALLADLESDVIVSDAAVRLSDAQAVRLGLAAGDKINLMELLKATMVSSGNDGALAIAYAVSGDEQAFVDVMNRYAVSIGCTDTHFANPHGLHDEMHFTSARDMARIAFEAIHNEAFLSIAGIGRYTMAGETFVAKGNSFFANLQSDYYYPGAFGLKTGYHQQAGYCFIAAAEKDGQRMIAAVFGCSSYGACFRAARALLDAGFDKK